MDASVLAGAVGVVATATFWLAARRVAALRASWRARRRTRRALSRERDAEPLLRAEGYRVEETQARRLYRVLRDGMPLEVELRADLVVRRAGRRYVADVKTGREAPRLTTPATRRQLLEYRVAYDVDGVLLVDMEAGAIHVVDFDIGGRERPSRRLSAWWPFVTGLLLGVALAMSWSHWFTHGTRSALIQGRGE